MSTELVIPRAPKGATHARLQAHGSGVLGGVATVMIKDFDTLRGVPGLVTWLKPESSRTTRNMVQVGASFEWNGYQALDELGNPVTVVVTRRRGRPRKKR